MPEDGQQVISEDVNYETSDEHVENSNPETNALSSKEPYASKDDNNDEHIQGDTTGNSVQFAQQQQQINVTVSELQYNNEGQSLVFKFQSDDDTVYSAHLLGCTFKIDNANGYSDTSLSLEQRLEKMAAALAGNFLNNTSFDIRDTVAFSEQYGLIPHPIDAEKDNITNQGTDTNLCWAASSSDMLKFAQWDVTEGTTKTEDQIYNYYWDNFFDKGADAEVGTKWFINGISIVQEIDNNGNVVYENFEEKWAQEKAATIKSWKTENWNGFYPDNPAEDVVKYYGRNDIEKFADAVEELDSKNAVGLGVALIDSDNKNIGYGHAITLFGYIKSLAEEGLNALKAIFFADADNDAYKGVGEKGKKEEAIDSVTMYTVSPKQYTATNGGTTNTYDSISINGYSKNETTTYILEDYITLKNRNTYESGLGTDKTDSGTKNKKTDVDMVGKDCVVWDADKNVIKEADAGQTITFRTTVNNVSYRKLSDDEYAKNPHLQGTICIYREGETKLYDSVDFDVLLENYNWQSAPDLLPNKGISFGTNYTFTEAGKYEFLVHITGIRNEDGTYVNEAYVKNNFYTPSFIMTIFGNEAPPYTPSDEEKIPEYSSSYVKASKLPLKISIFPGDIGDIDVSTLVFKHLGIIIDKSMYTIEKCDDGSYILTFSSEFLSSLMTGEQDIEIFDPNGELLIIISISIK